MQNQSKLRMLLSINYYYHSFIYLFIFIYFLTALLTFNGMRIPKCLHPFKSDFSYVHGHEGYAKLYKGIKEVYHQGILHSQEHIFDWVNDSLIDLWPLTFCRQILNEEGNAQ